MPKLSIKGAEIEYLVRRSFRRRSVSLEVLPSYLLVRAPVRFSDRYIRNILSRHDAWIIRQNGVLNDLIIRTGRDYATGEQFPYLGSQHTLYVIPNKNTIRSSVEVIDRNIHVYVPEKSETTNPVRDILLNWYRTEALTYLPRRIGALSKKTGLEPSRVRIKNQATLWGSCSSKGSINLNWRLILAPISIVDYVALHELCHLRVANHSGRFWALLLANDPSYAKHRRWLRKNELELKMWFETTNNNR
jgi:hypothetical protein